MAESGTELHIDADDAGLSLRGELDAHTAPELESALAERAPVGSILRLRMNDLSFMDSSGLRVIIASTEAARAGGGDVMLVDPSSAVSRLIEVSGLGAHLTIEASDS